ncbi:MAG TPA: hypothetical protein VGE73_12130 [Pseudolabrys sp.]|nr:hypothetical protein [Hyphomicrobiales bacterium]OJY13844.1 MAG: hypothetical protein BGP05_07810 [Rhizobiales bacterium 62-47]
MTVQAFTAVLDQLEQTAHAASVSEENYRREAAARIQALEQERAFGFRRLALMRTVLTAIANCETEDDAILQGSAAFLQEVGWKTEVESQQEALEQFHPVIRACWQAAQAEKAEQADQPPAQITDKLNDFERWFGEARNGPFLKVLEREIVELPLVETC